MDRLMELTQKRTELLQEARARMDEGKMEEAEALAGQVKDAETEMYILAAERRAAADSAKETQGTRPLWNSAGEFFQAVAAAANPHVRADERLLQVRNTDTASGNNETTAADGGYLVPPEYAQVMINNAVSESLLASRVRRIQVSSPRLIIPYINETSRANGSRWGGVQAYWKGEYQQYQASKPTFNQMEIQLQKLTGLAFVTDELLEDAPAIASIIQQAFADEFRFKIDDAILNGTGTGMPLGILKTGTGGNAALVTATAGDSYAESVLAMWDRMQARDRNKAVWVINQDLETELMKMYLSTGESSGQLIYMPQNGLSASPYGKLLSRDVLTCEQSPAKNSLGAMALLDLSQYALIERYAGVKSATSVHVRFEYDEMAFKFTWRVGGAPLVKSAVTPFSSSVTRSPYVALSAITSGSES